jgi:diphthine-ammonia ligase
VTVTALVSGGKDSIYSAYLADTQGFTVDELVTMQPTDPDSMMFHTPNLDLVALQAEAWGKRHRPVAVEGEGEAAEEASLRRALAGETGWVVAGAIASSYQWSRLQSVCHSLGRPVYTPLWGKAPRRVVEEEIGAGLDVRFVHVAAEPLGPEWLGRGLDLAALGELERLSVTVRAVHPAGEGGEYESLVVDAPFFRSRIVLGDTERRSVGAAHRLIVRSAHLVRKPPHRGGAKSS